jgi:hypothetical protein
MLTLTAALFALAAIAFAVALWLARDLYRLAVAAQKREMKFGEILAAMALLHSSTAKLTNAVSERIVELESEWYIDTEIDDDDSDEDDEEIDEPTTPYERPANWWKQQ